MSKFFVFIFFVLVVIFSVRYSITKQAVFGDSLFYWAYTRSLYFDHDINLQNELTHHYSPESNNDSREPISNDTPIPKEVAHHLPIGPALFWLPPFLFADFLVLIAGYLNIPVVRNGYSDVYQLVVGIANIFYATLGIWIAAQLLLREYAMRIVRLCLLSLLFVTNLLFYSSFDPINSHPASLFISSLFLFIWYTTRKRRTLLHWLWLGVLGGLAMSIRTQDATIFTLVIGEIVYKFIINDKRQVFSKHRFFSALYLLAGFLIGFIPQLLVFVSVFHSFLSPYLYAKNAFDFTHPHLLNIVISAKVGVLYYSPLFIVCILGLFLRVKKERIYSIIMLFAFFTQYLIIGSYNGWHQGEAYGIRMFISSTPLFAFGLCEAIEVALKKVSYTAVVVLSILFFINNIQSLLFFLLLVHNKL